MESTKNLDSQDVTQDMAIKLTEACAVHDNGTMKVEDYIHDHKDGEIKPLNKGNLSDADDDAADRTVLNFVHLPEVILVKVMDFLELKDRYYLSLTCKLFYNLFTHPQLWKVARIDLLSAGKSDSRWKLKCIMNSTMVEIVSRFSYLFQHLSLNMDCNIQRFDHISAKLLKELIQDCRLQSLSIKLGPLTSDESHARQMTTYRSNPKDVPMVVGLIHNATRLKRLNIISWPLFTNLEEDCNILLAVQSNEKLKMLESLSLFFIDVKKQSWTERIPKLPSLERTLDLISYLPNLTQLSLRSPMISNELILLLASQGRKKLELFQILITFAHPCSYHDGFKIPDIASSAWQKLVKASPSLRVEFIVPTRVPWEHLGVILKPEVPLSSLSLLNFSLCNLALLEGIANHHKFTLRTFRSLCDSSDCDHGLKLLVKECHNLTTLVYHGDVNFSTVMELAELIEPKKMKWDLLQFKEKNIKTDPLMDEDDDDTVVKFDAVNQNYYLGAVHSWHRDEAFHQSKIDEMVDHVRNCLGTTSGLLIIE